MLKLLKFLIVLTATSLLWVSAAQASGSHDHHQTKVASSFALKAKPFNQPLHCLLNNHPLNHPCPHVKKGEKKVVRILADCGTETSATSSGSAFSGQPILLVAVTQFSLSSRCGEIFDPAGFHTISFPDPIDHPPQFV